MWKIISNLILRNRILIICVLSVLTGFLGHHATKIQLQYEFNKLLPSNDPSFLAYENFKSHFGHDGMMVVIATNEPDFYTEEKFNAWLQMGDSLKNIKVKIKDGDDIKMVRVVDSIFSEGHLYNIIKNKKESKFKLEEIVETYPLTANKVDSVENIIKNLKF